MAELLLFALALTVRADPDAAVDAPSDASRIAAGDSIVIPPGAKQVRGFDLFTHTTYTRLNEHMLIATAEVRPYLLVFDSCPALGRHDPDLEFHYKDLRSLRAGTDTVKVNGVFCVIDRIYKITQGDASALEQRFPRR
jgi:hypothetical protein